MSDAIKTLPAKVYPYNRALHYFAIFLTIWTFCVVALGGAVKSNESGLTIPEGFILQWLPDWWERPGLRLEFAHRMIVGVLGVGVFGMMVWTHIVESRPEVKLFSIYCVLGVLANAVLGYLTVRFFAHWHTSVPHVAVGHSLLGLIACFATMVSPSWVGATPVQVEQQAPAMRKMALWLLISAFVQLLLGAAIRHDDKGKALVDERYGLFMWHLTAHVLGALALGYFLSKVLVRVFKSHRGQSEILGPAKKIMMLLGLQFVLGPAAAMLKLIYSRDSLDADGPPMVRASVATAHVVVGALVLALCFVLYTRTRRYIASAASETARSNTSPVAEVSA